MIIQMVSRLAPASSVRMGPAYGGIAPQLRLLSPKPQFRTAPPRHRLHRTPARCDAQPPASTSTSHPSGWLVSTPESSPVSSDYDAIMVLGGGLTPAGGLPPWVERRLEGALHIYKQQQNPVPIVLLGAGTPHKRPVLDAAGFVLHESTAYARFLLDNGVPATDLLKEASSYDTVGNGYFSLTMHALPARWRRISVVTSAFHTPRTAAIFDSLYAIAGNDHYNDSDAFTLEYHPVSDEGLFDADVAAARATKEAAAVVAWRNNVAKLPDMPAIHTWLFSTHLCYAVCRQHEFGIKDDLDPKLAATY